jgi:hypothetical protein
MDLAGGGPAAFAGAMALANDGRAIRMQSDANAGEVNRQKSAAVLPRQHTAGFEGFPAPAIKAKDPIGLGDGVPNAIINLIASRIILHGAPALAEIAVSIGALNPLDHRTRATLIPIVETLMRINPVRIIAPTYELWLEASVITGILARTQGIPKQDRRKFRNDTLLFLQAADSGSVMISRNSRDLDLLLQLKPETGVLLYDKNDKN